jgi:hypothetical protein
MHRDTSKYVSIYIYIYKKKYDIFLQARVSVCQSIQKGEGSTRHSREQRKKINDVRVMMTCVGYSTRHYPLLPFALFCATNCLKARIF